MDNTRLADSARFLRHVFIRDLMLMAAIGVYASEHGVRQRIRLNIDLAVDDEGASRMSRQAVGRDDLARVVDYDAIAQAVRGIVADGHVQLVETLAERIAESLLTDKRVRIARVRVEKLDVFPDAGSAGVEIERRQR
jgi:dihydroneopterin aldolase